MAENSQRLNPPGIREAGNAGIVTMTAATTMARQHQVNTNRRARITKIHAINYGASASRLAIGDSSDGTSAGVFTQRLPAIPLTAGQDMYLTEDMIVGYEFNPSNNICCQMSAATSSMEVLIEVEEVGG